MTAITEPMITNTFHIRHLVLPCILLVAVACGSKQGHDDHHDADTTTTWAGMDEFHQVMAESFHPFKDSANLLPAKANAHAMAAAAQVWGRSPVPSKVDRPEVSEKLDQLQSDAIAFEQTAQSGSDEEVGRSLTALHTLFHQLEEAWYGGEESHSEHH
ncbi:MAG TPA: hypothetical protein VK666_25405 [Chryseolinea sp.]|nr:hypothetical protein [Chryseolinea sp.]